ncbi:MAG TPA: tetratricopeptide repeat protein [Candidatus Eisenbacteria bacterium]
MRPTPQARSTSRHSTLLVLVLALVAGSCGGTPDPTGRSAQMAVASALARQLAPHVAAGERRTVASIIEDAMARPDVAWVIVQDTDGQSVASVQRGDVDREAARTAIVRGAWCPTTATWTECRATAPSVVHNIGIPIPGAGATDAPILGTLNLGFRDARVGIPFSGLIQRGRRNLGALPATFGSQVTTASSQARRYYDDGIEAIRKFYDNEARTAWMMALEEDPHLAMAMVRLGRLAHDLADDEGALDWYRRATIEEARVTDRERLEIRLLGADLEGRESDERALEDELIRRFHDDADVLILAANQHLSEGRPDEALSELQRAEEIDPARTDVWNLLGYARSELGSWPEAEDAFERYVFVHEQQANPHDSLGEFYLRTGRYRKALAQFETACEIKPDFSWAHYHLALVNAELGRWEASLFAIQRARDISGESPEGRQWSRTQIALHLRAGRIAEAASLAEVHCSAYALKPADQALLARVALAVGDRAGTRQYLDAMLLALQQQARARGCDLTEVDNYYNLPELEALLLLGAGSPREAVDLLDRALPAAHHWEARQRIERETIGALIDSKRPDEALRRLEKVLARNPNDPAANWSFARILESRGEVQEARAALARARQALEGADEDDPLTAAVREASRGTGG